MSKYSPNGYANRQRQRYRRQMKFFILWFVGFGVSIFLVGKGGVYAYPFQLLLVVMGCVMVRDIGHHLSRTLASRRWPKTLFKPVNISVDQSASEQGRWRVSMDLSYRVDGVDYCQRCHDLNIHRFQFEQGARDFVEQVRQGEWGDYIFYNPVEPGESYLNPGVSLRSVLGLVVALAMIVLPPLWAMGLISAR